MEAEIVAMKILTRTGLAVAALGALSACGLRGDLERPPPIFSDPPSEEAKLPVDAPVQYAVKDVLDTTYYNSLGGEIPRPAPANDIDEEQMEEVSPG